MSEVKIKPKFYEAECENAKTNIRKLINIVVKQDLKMLLSHYRTI